MGWISQTEFITEMAEVGVIILMFSVGLESDLKELIKTGPVLPGKDAKTFRKEQDDGEIP